MKIRIDTTRCSGIGLCEMTAPGIFEIGDDGQSHLLDGAEPDAALAAEAASSCPTGAISIEN